MWLTCPTCGHGWESRAKKRSRCGSCRKTVSVPAPMWMQRGRGMRVSLAAPAFPVGVVAVVLIAAGIWMLYHAKTTDPADEPEGYEAWHWVLGGLGCLGSGGLLGAYAIGVIGGEE